MTRSTSRQVKFLIIFVLCFLLNPYHFLPVTDDVRQLIRFSVYILVAIYGLWLFREEIVKDCLKSRKHLWTWLGGFLVLVALVLVGEVVSSILTDILHQILDSTEGRLRNQLSLEALLNHRLLYLPAILSISVTGPIVEELVFRKSMIDVGKQYLPIPIVIILQALLFAAIHIRLLQVSELINLMSHLTTGLIYGAVYSKTGQILYPISVHILFNTLGIVMFFLA